MKARRVSRCGEAVQGGSLSTRPLPSFICRTDSEHTPLEIEDRPPLRQWSRGRVTLVGDASFRTSPYAEAYMAGMRKTFHHVPASPRRSAIWSSTTPFCRRFTATRSRRISSGSWPRSEIRHCRPPIDSVVPQPALPATLGQSIPPALRHCSHFDESGNQQGTRISRRPDTRFVLRIEARPSLPWQRRDRDQPVSDVSELKKRYVCPRYLRHTL
jgi:hypothetical protein